MHVHSFSNLRMKVSQATSCSNLNLLPSTPCKLLSSKFKWSLKFYFIFFLYKSMGFPTLLVIIKVKKLIIHLEHQVYSYIWKRKSYVCTNSRIFFNAVLDESSFICFCPDANQLQRKRTTKIRNKCIHVTTTTIVHTCYNNNLQTF